MSVFFDEELDGDFMATKLFTAIREQDIPAVRMCIRSGDNVNFRCKKSGMTYLHVIINSALPMTEIKYVPIIHQLSNADADLNAKDKKGVCLLHLALRKQLLEVMATLLRCGAEYDLHVEENIFTSLRGPFKYELLNRYKSFSPGYWNAVRDNKAFRVNVLVKSWCRINISKDGITLIEFAKKQNANEKIVKQLIENEATIEFAHATIAGDVEKMNYLMSHYPVDLSTTDLSHRENFFEPYSPLSLHGAAIKYGHKHVLPFLKQANNCENEDIAKRRPSSVQSSSICSIS